MRTIHFLICGICLAFAGCGADSAPPAETIAPNVTPASDVSVDGKQEKTEKLEATEEAILTTFDPPFPNRTDMFAQPPVHKAAAVVRERREQNGEDVQLKGFVHVDQPRAMLRLDGELWIAAVGDVRDGFRVVSVAPPKVILNRHDKEIQLSLLNGG